MPPRCLTPLYGLLFPTSLSDWSWEKATLPSSLGGLNLRLASIHAPAAFIGSLVRCQDLISRVLGQTPNESSHLHSTFLALVHNAARTIWHSLEDIDIPLTQKALSRAIDEATFDHLLASAADTRSKALVLSSSIPYASDWINVIPSQALGIHFLDREFRGCLQYWLGLPMIEEGHHCPFCQSPADRFGDHQVGCGGNGDRIHRHDSLRDALFSAAQSAALEPRKEMPSLVPGSASRTADVFLPTWERDQPAALDVTVVSTLQNRTVVRAASVSGYALSVARERNMAAHSESCQSVGVSFIPMVVETLGGWDEEATLKLSYSKVRAFFHSPRQGRPAIFS